jgi:hypothetical protein
MAIQVLSIAPNRDRETFDVTFAKYAESLGEFRLWSMCQTTGMRAPTVRRLRRTFVNGSPNYR